jgi:hypothetical protein
VLDIIQTLFFRSKNFLEFHDIPWIIYPALTITYSLYRRKVNTQVREYYNRKEKKMGKTMKERRVYTQVFKAEAAALAEKREKPARQIA